MCVSGIHGRRYCISGHNSVQFGGQFRFRAAVHHTRQRRRCYRQGGFVHRQGHSVAQNNGLAAAQRYIVFPGAFQQSLVQCIDRLVRAFDRVAALVPLILDSTRGGGRYLHLRFVSVGNDLRCWLSDDSDTRFYSQFRIVAFGSAKRVAHGHLIAALVTSFDACDRITGSFLAADGCTVFVPLIIQGHYSRRCIRFQHRCDVIGRN